MKGIAVFYKPKGWTSYDVIRFLKKELKEKKIGHGGTLDPMAEGVLIIGIKKEGTKKLKEFLKESKKEYIAEIALGGISDTFDKEGKIEKYHIENWPTIEQIKNTLEEFKGKILQKPPIYSAKKISGIRAYQLAREGKKINLKEREVEVEEIEFLGWEQREEFLKVKIRLVVKSGFYVRSFAHDLGKKLQTGGFLENLQRTKVGEFTIREAIRIDDFKAQNLELYFKAYGLVQGVGFRFFTQKWAGIFGIKGKAQNLKDGGIEIIGQGQEKNLQAFLEKILQGPSSSRIDEVFYYFRKPQLSFFGFEIY